MATQRIGDRELAAGAAQRSAHPSRLSWLTTAIATPLGILIVLPLLVGGVALVLTLIGQRALKQSNLSVARGRLDEETALVAQNIRVALAQADPILDRLRPLAIQHQSDDELAPIAHTLHDLINGRPGVSYVSISFPDGTFEGAYLDTDGQIRFQQSRVLPGGTRVRRYNLVGHERLELQREEPSTYDPRTRSFYALATATGARVWTMPYPFFGSHLTGISRTQPVFARRKDGEEALHAVLTVDFDVSSLSDALNRVSLDDTVMLLYANDGTVLAYPKGAAAIEKLPLRTDRALMYGDLSDPVLDRFFNQQVLNKASAPSLTLDVAGATYLVSLKSITNDSGIPWSVAALVPEARILSPLHAHQRTSLAAALLATSVAALLAWLFARHILRARNEIAQARAEAQAAIERARELGSYRLVERLGKGGMGEVWRAEHRLLVRQAAIKLISIDGSSANRKEVEERFRREAQSLATLESRNTIELFDYGVTADGTLFFVMELLDGVDLEYLVMRWGPQSAGRVIHFLIQACNSLAEAHDAGLVHRDIKPANLYVCRVADEVDVIKVLDFGLVRSALSNDSLPLSAREPVLPSNTTDPAAPLSDARLTQMGAAMGTPAFMAPEQALGHDTDGRADTYALGCVAFFLLTGRLLFEKNASLPMMMAHITEDVPDLAPLCKYPPPPELTELIHRCLAKNPEDRPPTARHLATALRAIPLPTPDLWTPELAEKWWALHRPRTKRPHSLAPASASS